VLLHFTDIILKNSVGLLFSVIAIGWLLGSLPLGKMKLGGSGVLISGLLFGHFGYSLPSVLQNLGVVLFVYAVGLKAGPQIFQALKRSKGQFFISAFLITFVAGSVTWLSRALFDFPQDIMAGVYAGAMTSTPALAAVTQTVAGSAAPVGYGLAYPLGVLGVIFATYFLPIIFKTNLKEEEKKYREDHGEAAIQRRCFRVTNPNVVNLALAESLKDAAGRYRIVRIQREGEVFTPVSDDVLLLNDLILAVGVGEELEKLRFLIGDSTDDWVPETSDTNSKWLVLTSKNFIGKQLGSLEISSLYGVVITRVRRSNIEFMATSNFVFEAGDEIRVSAAPSDINRFEKLVGQDRETLHETSMLSLAIGLLCGISIGLIKIPLPGGLSLGLGLAGGPLVAGLIFGYFGRFGKLTGHMPCAAVNLLGELGLYFFLAVAGLDAGAHFVEVLRNHGILMIACGALVTLLPIVFIAVIGRFIFKMNMLVLLGMICGGMTSTPALGVLLSNTKSDVPSLSYAGIYPIAVLFTTLMAQCLILF